MEVTIWAYVCEGFGLISIQSVNDPPLLLSRAATPEAEQRAVEHARRIAEQSVNGLDTKPAREFLADLEECIEGMREHLAEEERMPVGWRVGAMLGRRIGSQ